ncbi:MAG: hypothetical protein IR164_17895 [Devosia sp.]|uniref:beta strand repeat-containing protein n=1 Tax=Devosia sp. TaxID=1871048 RepID=UPI0019FDD8CF|nr:hypothetical protein [Devosia sp.]MBF0680801.1 hypothetical protein [Devosia sp.]
MATIQGVYVALFGRPADPTGLAYFNSVTQNGADLTQIGDLSSTQEYQDRFAGQTPAQIVNSIYQSLFNRNAEPAGLTFFVNGLVTGEFSINDIAIRILDGAQGSDKTVVDTKIAAANLYTNSLDTTEEIIAYSGNAAAAEGRAFLQGVSTTVPNQAAVDDAIEDMVGPGGVPGDTYTLTTGVDTLLGTANNDTFQAIIDGGATDTVNTFDSVDGAAGNDTLLIVGAGVVPFPANVTIKNVEVVNVGTAAAIANLNSSSFQGVQQLWQVGAAGAVTIGAGVTAGFRNVAANTVIAADGVSSVAVALDNADDASIVTIDETTAGDVTSVTVSGSVDGDFEIDTATNTTDVATINLGITTNSIVTLNVGLAATTTIDASDSSGNLTLDASAITALETFNGGSGNDTLTADSSVLTAAAITIDAGAGVDVINYNIDHSVAGNTTSITGGIGGDTFILSGTENLSAAGDVDDLEANLVTITDFDGAEDVLDLTAVVGGDRLTQNAVNIALTAADPADLFEAADAVAGALVAAGDYAFFAFGGDTYFYSDSNGDGALSVDDALIQLTGVAVADLTAANLIV